MHITDLMTTALITGSPEDLVDESLMDMKLAEIRHLPVVDSRGHLVGIISDRDVLRTLGAKGSQEVHLKDIMSTRVQMVEEHSDAADALALMLDNKIGSLPVIGAEGQLVGIVTETDFLQIAHSLLSWPQSLDEDVASGLKR